MVAIHLQFHFPSFLTFPEALTFLSVTIEIVILIWFSPVDISVCVYFFFFFFQETRIACCFWSCCDLLCNTRAVSTRLNTPIHNTRVHSSFSQHRHSKSAIISTLIKFQKKLSLQKKKKTERKKKKKKMEKKGQCTPVGGCWLSSACTMFALPHMQHINGSITCVSMGVSQTLSERQVVGFTTVTSGGTERRQMICGADGEDYI